jgi:hypothetical protein
MKESELIKKMNSITNHLKETKLVDKAYELAKTKGEGSTEIHPYHTHLNYIFSKDNLTIELNDGLSQMGGGTIKVIYNDDFVLTGNRNARDKLEYKYNPEVSGFGILTYKSGEWEEKIKKYLKQKNVKKVVIKKPEVSREVLDSLSRNFNIKI